MLPTTNQFVPAKPFVPKSSSQMRLMEQQYQQQAAAAAAAAQAAQQAQQQQPVLTAAMASSLDPTSPNPTAKKKRKVISSGDIAAMTDFDALDAGIEDEDVVMSAPPQQPQQRPLVQVKHVPSRYLSGIPSAAAVQQQAPASVPATATAAGAARRPSSASGALKRPASALSDSAAVGAQLNESSYFQGRPSSAAASDSGQQQHQQPLDRAALLEQYRAAKAAAKASLMKPSQPSSSGLNKTMNKSSLNTTTAAVVPTVVRHVDRPSTAGGRPSMAGVAPLPAAQRPQTAVPPPSTASTTVTRGRAPSPAVGSGAAAPAPSAAHLKRARSPSPVPQIGSAQSGGIAVSARIDNHHDSLIEKIKELQMLETVLLQLSFMNLKVQQVFSEQEHKAMLQLHGAWLLLQQHKHKLKQSEYSLERERIVVQVHSIVQRQAPLFDKILSNFTMFTQCYDSFSQALINTTHKLPTAGICTDSFQQTENELIATLSRSQDILSVLKGRLDGCTKKIGDIASTFEKLHSIVQQCDQEAAICCDNLAHDKQLSDEEQSLMAHSLQQEREINALTESAQPTRRICTPIRPSNNKQDETRSKSRIPTLEEALGLLDVT